MRFDVELYRGNPVARGDFGSVLADLQAVGEGDGWIAFIIRIFEGQHEWIRGNAGEAVELLRALAEAGHRQRRGGFHMARLLANLAIALTDLDQLSQARVITLEVLPLIRSCGLWTSMAPGLAYLTAKRGRIDTAARLLGAADVHHFNVDRRRFIQRRCHDKTLALIRSQYAEEQISAWRAEAAALGEEEFMRLVIEEG
jgi:hypothetical protein